MSRDRCASRFDPSSTTEGRGAGSSALCPRVRASRTPRGAGASAARARLRAPWRSGAESLPSLCPTTSEHAPTTLRCHPGHEAVLALPRALLGLVGPLHRCVPFLVQRSRSRPFTHERLAFSQPARVELVARLALVRDSTGVGWGRSNEEPARCADALPARIGRCYSGATPGPERPILSPIRLRRRTHPALEGVPRIGSETLD